VSVTIFEIVCEVLTFLVLELGYKSSPKVGILLWIFISDPNKYAFGSCVYFIVMVLFMFIRVLYSSVF